MNEKKEYHRKQTFSLYGDTAKMLLEICNKRDVTANKRGKISPVICDAIKRLWEEEVQQKGE
jgi:hypothetical protein